jgi:hypothetical protein
MKQRIKKLMYWAAPVCATSFFSARARSHSHRVVTRWGCVGINESLFNRFGNRVLSGPFQGLALTPATRAEQVGPYLLGLYESELQPAWDLVLRGSYSQVVVVGAKFGYYAVGLARRYPNSRVIAFDTDHWARRVLKGMNRDNSVSNVEVRGYCSADWLATNLAEGAFVLSDCEGFEGDLLCSRSIVNLPSATLVVETHNQRTPGVSAHLRELLRSSHRVWEIRSDSSPRQSPVDLSFLSASARALATCEVRDAQCWLVGLPKAGPNRSLMDWAPGNVEALSATVPFMIDRAAPSAGDARR